MHVSICRCTKKVLKCKAKVYTMGPELTISRSEAVHNHQEESSKINKKMVSESCKRKAEEDISEKPSKIIRTVLAENLPDTSTTDVSNIRKNIYHCRRKILPCALPRNIN